MNISTKILLDQIKKTHMYLEQTMDGVTNEVAHFQPSGTANPIAGTYAHLVFTEDAAINFMCQKKAPLFESSWKDKTSASKQQPMDWVNEYPKWLRSVTIDVTKFREYSKAVFENTEKYVETLTDADLEKQIKLDWEPEPRPLYDILNMLVISHANNIMGEIAVIKGLQGLKGYPF